MRIAKRKILKRSYAVIFFLAFTSIISYAQQPLRIVWPAINVVPNGLTKTNYTLYKDKSEKIKSEKAKLLDEKKNADKKWNGASADSPKGKEYQTEFAALTLRSKELISQINAFNTEIEAVVFKDIALDKLSLITYYTLKKDQKSWDEFQSDVDNEKAKLVQDKIKIQQELTKINTKQKIKTPFNEGVILSMYTAQDVTQALKDSLKSPFTGVRYKETQAKEALDSTGVVIVSFVMPKPDNNPLDVASKALSHSISPESFSLDSPEAIAELNKLKDKKFNRLIAHSNGANVAECLLKDSLIEVKELNIIGGDKSLLNGDALQHLLDTKKVKHITVWIKLDDPDLWITPLDDEDIKERSENFIAYRLKFASADVYSGNSKVDYKWILSNDNLAALSARDPQFIVTYFKEISKAFKSN